MASEKEIADFLKSIERKSFKKIAYHTRDEEAALDIVQDSMMKLCTSYPDKPVAELPLLFQRILNNTMLDWFRRQKTRNAVLVNFSEFEPKGAEAEGFDVMEALGALSLNSAEQETSAEDQVNSQQTLKIIDAAVQNLPERQRQAFLLRYWEEMDVNETAQVMGCSAGSVKTHCSRALATLAKVLAPQGIQP